MYLHIFLQDSQREIFVKVSPKCVEKSKARKKKVRNIMTIKIGINLDNSDENINLGNLVKQWAFIFAVFSLFII